MGSDHSRTERAGRRLPGLVALVAVAAVIVGLAAGPPTAAQTTENIWLTERRFLNMAHGGGLHEVPQGTLYAYKTAAERGANTLEMDLHITLDGHVVAIHDSTVDRTTDGTGCVVAKTLAEIKALDAAHTFVPGRGPTSSAAPEDYTMRGIATGDVAPPAGFDANDFTIATLEEIFLAEPDALMLMELKPTEVYQSHDCPGFVDALDPADRPDLAAEVARLIDVHDMTDRVMVASFIDDLIHRFQSFAPDVDTSFPVEESIAVYLAFLAGDPLPNPSGHEAFQLPLNFSGIEITEDLVTYARAHGIAVHFWTINDVDTMRMLIDWGADGIITDRPQVLAALLDELNPPPPTTTTPPTEPAPAPSTSTTTTTVPDPVDPDVTTTTVAASPDTTEPVRPTPPTDPGTSPGTDSDGGSAGGGRTALDRTGSSLGSTAFGLVLMGAGALVLSLRRFVERRPEGS